MPNSGDTDAVNTLGSVGSSGALAPSEAAQPAESTSVEGVGAIDGTVATAELASPQAIAEALASGTIDGPTAQAQLIEAAVRARLPPEAPAEAVAAMRAEVAALVGADPILAQLLRP